MNLAGRYQLAEGVAVRTERFGGLVYNYHNRRLYFIHSHEVTEFVSRLTGDRPLVDAMQAFRLSHGLSAEAGGAILKSLAALEKIGLVVPVAG
jgi:putative mycofactocin binding protein MftB